MKKFVVIAAVLVAALAYASLAQAEDVGINLNLDEIDGSGITGSAQLGSTTEDLSVTEVMVDMGGLTPDASHINHIHDGTGCGDGDYGAVVVTLTELEADANGSATANTTVTALDAGDPISFDEIADGSHVLIVHDAAGAPAACEAIPAAELPADPTAAAPTATVSALGQTGAELPNDGDGSLGVLTVLIAALAALGLASLGLAYAAQRNRS